MMGWLVWYYSDTCLKYITVENGGYTVGNTICCSVRIPIGTVEYLLEITFRNELVIYLHEYVNSNKNFIYSN